MDYGYKPTTNGRRVLIACMESGEKLELTRVAVGKGLVSESADLANQHTLVDYVADGAIGDRRHENDRLYLTVQYSNQTNRDVPTFYLSEFIVYAKNPDTNQETDLLYATLGDYAQPVPAYVRDMPASVFNFPLVMVLSDEINVSISAPAGLVTYDELAELQRHIDLTIPRTGWVADTDTNGDFAYHRDIAIERAAERMVPQLTILPDSAKTAWDCELANFTRAIAGAVRVYARRVPTAAMSGSLMLLSNPPYLRSDGTSGMETITAGRGLTLNRGVMSVNIGSGVSVDSANNLTVDQQTVVTDADMVNEDAAAQDLQNILLNGDNNR